MHTRDQGLAGKLRWLVPLATFGLMGCPNYDLAPLDPCTVSGAQLEVPQEGVDKVDLLFVVDNSGSMAEEQLSLRQQLSRMVLVLTSGDKEAGKSNPTDYPERYFTPVKSLQLGVVSTDLGAGGNAIDGCQTPDDGVLQNSSELAANGFQYRDANQELQMFPGDMRCAGVSVPLYQTFIPPADPTQLQEAATKVADDFGCIATLGTLGCGFEQQLEAMLKALSPSDRGDFLNYRDFMPDGTFSQGSQFNGISPFGRGNPSGANAGFVRDDAVLAVVIVSDEEDCSITPGGVGLFAPSGLGDFANEPVNLRCGYHRNDPNLVHPVERYIQGLRDLKPGNPGLIIFAGIVGVDPMNEDLPLSDMLQVTQFSFTGDPNNPNAQPDPACIARDPMTDQRTGVAYPGERFIQVASAFGDNGVIKSICNDDFGPALDVIIEKIAAQLTGACLPRQLPLDDNGLVECEVLEVMSQANSQQGAAACDPQKGRTFLGTRRFADANRDVSERVVCKVDQVAVVDGQPQGVGWYYDNFSDEVKDACPALQQQQIAFSANADLAAQSQAIVECFQPVARIDPLASGRQAVNRPCGAAGEVCPSTEGEELICVNDTCQLACPRGSDSECPPGWVCHNDGANSFCVSPTCPPSFVQE